MTVNGQQVPGPLLQSALDYVNDALQRMANTIQADGEANSTAIVLTAKHGQSPQNNSQLQRIDDGPIIAGVNAAWTAQHPGSQTLVVQEADDDGLLVVGCRTGRRRRPTSSRTTCGPTPPQPSITSAKPSPSSTRACSRSMPALSRRSSSASRARTRITPTCSGSPRSAPSIRPDRRLPSTVATIRPTGMFPSSSMRRARSAPASQATGWKRPRSRRRSCSCSDSRRGGFRPFSRRARRSSQASAAGGKRLIGSGCRAAACPPGGPASGGSAPAQQAAPPLHLWSTRSRKSRPSIAARRRASDRRCAISRLR